MQTNEATPTTGSGRKRGGRVTVTVDGKIVDATEVSEMASAKRAAGNAAREAIDITAIRERVDELLALHERAQDAAGAFKDAIDAVATKSGVGKKALRAYVKARAADKVKETHAAAEQLSLLFEEL